MSDSQPSTPRTFYCWDSLWQSYVDMSSKSGLSVDALLNEALASYLRTMSGQVLPTVQESPNEGFRLAPASHPMIQSHQPQNCGRAPIPTRAPASMPPMSMTPVESPMMSKPMMTTQSQYETPAQPLLPNTLQVSAPEKAPISMETPESPVVPTVMTPQPSPAMPYSSGQNGVSQFPSGQNGSSQFPSGQNGSSQFPSGQNVSSQFPSGQNGVSQFPSGQNGASQSNTPQFPPAIRQFVSQNAPTGYVQGIQLAPPSTGIPSSTSMQSSAGVRNTMPTQPMRRPPSSYNEPVRQGLNLASVEQLSAVRSSSSSAPKGMPSLYIVFANKRYLVDKDKYIIGRSSQLADLVIRDSNISRKHCAVIYKNGAFYIKDLDSTNGIEFKGNRIDAKRIEEGDQFNICEFHFTFTYR